MFHADPDVTVHAFRSVVEMEARGEQLDDVLRRLRGEFLHARGTESLPRTVGILDELHWHLQQFLDQSIQLDRSLGIKRRSVQAPESGKQGMPGVHVRGDVSVLSIEDLVTSLARRQKTGTLRLATRHGETIVLEFLRGAVVHVVSDTPLPSRMLGNILVAHDKLSVAKLEQFLAGFSPQTGPIGEALARAKLVAGEDLLHAIEDQARQLFDRVFAIENATFSFVEGPISELEHRVTLSVAALLGDAEPRREAQEPAGDEADDQACGIEVSELLEAFVQEQAIILTDEEDDEELLRRMRD